MPRGLVQARSHDLPVLVLYEASFHSAYNKLIMLWLGGVALVLGGGGTGRRPVEAHVSHAPALRGLWQAQKTAACHC